MVSMLLWGSAQSPGVSGMAPSTIDASEKISIQNILSDSSWHSAEGTRTQAEGLSYSLTILDVGVSRGILFSFCRG